MKKSFRIISLLLVLVLSICVFVGCAEDPETEAKLAVEQLFSNFKSDNIEEIKTKLGIDEMAQDNQFFSDKTLGIIFENLEYTINGVEVINEDAVDVSVSITNIDMKLVFKDFVKEFTEYGIKNPAELGNMSEEEASNKAFEFFEKSIEKEWDTVTKDVVIRVEKTDGYWDIAPEEVLIDAILGGITEAIESME